MIPRRMFDVRWLSPVDVDCAGGCRGWPWDLFDCHRFEEFVGNCSFIVPVVMLCLGLLGMGEVAENVVNCFEEEDFEKIHDLSNLV